MARPYECKSCPFKTRGSRNNPILIHYDNGQRINILSNRYWREQSELNSQEAQSAFFQEEPCDTVRAKQMDILQQCSLTTFSPLKQVPELTSHVCRMKLLDGVVLSAVIERTMPAHTKDVFGHPHSYWKDLAIWFQHNECVIELLLVTFESGFVLPFWLWLEIAKYLSVFMEGREKSVHKWILQLYEINKVIKHKKQLY